MERTVGVLGGMGPEATAIFYLRLVQATPARSDQEHLRVLILSNPKIPDRSRFLFDSGPSPVPELIRSARELEKFGADFIAIPCNTVHYFYREIQQSVNVPVLNIIEETAEAIRRWFSTGERPGGGERVGILATEGSIRTELFQRALCARGLSFLLPEEAVQKSLQQCIYWIKGGENRGPAREGIQEAIGHLEERGATALIYGCTELSVLETELSTQVPVFDTTRVLAEASVRFARQME